MNAKRKQLTRLLTAASLLIAAAWFLLGVCPSHWMRRVDFGRVQIDQHPASADIYFANPNGEAEAVALVRLTEGNSYFFDFGSEKFRLAKRSECVRLVAGVWCFRSLPNGVFRDPLPFTKLNEFRIAEQNGRVISVEF